MVPALLVGELKIAFFPARVQTLEENSWKRNRYWEVVESGVCFARVFGKTRL